MTPLQFSMAHLKHRFAATLLTVAMLSLGLATVIALCLFTKQIEKRLTKDVKGIDLVVSAQDDATQLVRNYLYHVDTPGGAMSFAEANSLRNNPLVSWSAPLVLGDTYKGFRIVGTEQKFSFLYGAILDDSGSFWGTPYDVVLGSAAAKRTGLLLGDRFKITHGLSRGGKVHHQDYVVTGVLHPTGAVIDQLILTSAESLWDTHGTNDVTALLVRTKSPQALAQKLRKTTKLAFAAPGSVAAELRGQVRPHLRPFIWAGYGLIGLGLASIFITLQTGLADRRSDMAMLQVMGATKRQLFGYVVAEGITLVALGTIFGWLLGHLSLEALSWILANTKSVGLTGFAWAAGEIWLLPCILLLGTVVALFPAWQASRTNVRETLAA